MMTKEEKVEEAGAFAIASAGIAFGIGLLMHSFFYAFGLSIISFFVGGSARWLYLNRVGTNG